MNLNTLCLHIVLLGVACVEGVKDSKGNIKRHYGVFVSKPHETAENKVIDHILTKTHDTVKKDQIDHGNAYYQNTFRNNKDTAATADQALYKRAYGVSDKGIFVNYYKNSPLEYAPILPPADPRLHHHKNYAALEDDYHDDDDDDDNNYGYDDDDEDYHGHNSHYHHGHDGYDDDGDDDDDDDDDSENAALHGRGMQDLSLVQHLKERAALAARLVHQRFDHERLRQYNLDLNTRAMASKLSNYHHDMNDELLFKLEQLSGHTYNEPGGGFEPLGPNLNNLPIYGHAGELSSGITYNDMSRQQGDLEGLNEHLLSEQLMRHNEFHRPVDAAVDTRIPNQPFNHLRHPDWNLHSAIEDPAAVADRATYSIGSYLAGDISRASTQATASHLYDKFAAMDDNLMHLASSRKFMPVGKSAGDKVSEAENTPSSSKEDVTAELRSMGNFGAMDEDLNKLVPSTRLTSSFGKQIGSIADDVDENSSNSENPETAESDGDQMKQEPSSRFMMTGQTIGDVEATVENITSSKGAALKELDVPQVKQPTSSKLEPMGKQIRNSETKKTSGSKEALANALKSMKDFAAMENKFIKRHKAIPNGEKTSNVSTSKRSEDLAVQPKKNQRSMIKEKTKKKIPQQHRQITNNKKRKISGLKSTKKSLVRKQPLNRLISNGGIPREENSKLVKSPSKVTTGDQRGVVPKADFSAVKDAASFKRTLKKLDHIIDLLMTSTKQSKAVKKTKTKNEHPEETRNKSEKLHKEETKQHSDFTTKNNGQKAVEKTATAKAKVKETKHDVKLTRNTRKPFLKSRSVKVVDKPVAETSPSNERNDLDSSSYNEQSSKSTVDTSASDALEHKNNDEYKSLTKAEKQAAKVRINEEIKRKYARYKQYLRQLKRQTQAVTTLIPEDIEHSPTSDIPVMKTDKRTHETAEDPDDSVLRWTNPRPTMQQNILQIPQNNNINTNKSNNESVKETSQIDTGNTDVNQTTKDSNEKLKKEDEKNKAELQASMMENRRKLEKEQKEKEERIKKLRLKAKGETTSTVKLTPDSVRRKVNEDFSNRAADKTTSPSIKTKTGNIKDSSIATAAEESKSTDAIDIPELKAEEIKEKADIKSEADTDTFENESSGEISDNKADDVAEKADDVAEKTENKEYAAKKSEDKTETATEKEGSKIAAVDTSENQTEEKAEDKESSAERKIEADADKGDRKTEDELEKAESKGDAAENSANKTKAYVVNHGSKSDAVDTETSEGNSSSSSGEISENRENDVTGTKAESRTESVKNKSANNTNAITEKQKKPESESDPPVANKEDVAELYRNKTNAAAVKDESKAEHSDSVSKGKTETNTENPKGNAADKKTNGNNIDSKPTTKSKTLKYYSTTKATSKKTEDDYEGDDDDDDDDVGGPKIDPNDADDPSDTEQVINSTRKQLMDGKIKSFKDFTGDNSTDSRGKVETDHDDRHVVSLANNSDVRHNSNSYDEEENKSTLKAKINSFQQFGSKNESDHKLDDGVSRVTDDRNDIEDSATEEKKYDFSQPNSRDLLRRPPTIQQKIRAFKEVHTEALNYGESSEDMKENSKTNWMW